MEREGERERDYYETQNTDNRRLLYIDFLSEYIYILKMSRKKISLITKSFRTIIYSSNLSIIKNMTQIETFYNGFDDTLKVVNT